jgi:transposase
MDIIAMRRNGYSIRKIAKICGIHRNTVKGHLENPSFPEFQKEKRKVSILEPYTQIIQDYLEQDDYQATWIYDRLKRMGYAGSYYREHEIGSISDACITNMFFVKVLLNDPRLTQLPHFSD